MSECQTSGAEDGWRETVFAFGYNLKTDLCATYYELFKKYHTRKNNLTLTY